MVGAWPSRVSPTRTATTLPWSTVVPDSRIEGRTPTVKVKYQVSLPVTEVSPGTELASL